MISWTGPGASWQLPPSGALAAALAAVGQGTPHVLSLISGSGVLPHALTANEPILTEIQPVARTSRGWLTAPPPTC
ncbi:MAG: hypothetical protein M3143_05425 [Actinomycetota bacterium]|nr:hypothetical protein [Actinomycetota bacterium]